MVCEKENKRILFTHTIFTIYIKLLIYTIVYRYSKLHHLSTDVDLM